MFRLANKKDADTYSFVSRFRARTRDIHTSSCKTTIEQSFFLRPQFLCSADGSSWPYKVVRPEGTTLLLFGAKNVL